MDWRLAWTALLLLQLSQLGSISTWTRAFYEALPKRFPCPCGTTKRSCCRWSKLWGSQNFRPVAQGYGSGACRAYRLGIEIVNLHGQNHNFRHWLFQLIVPVISINYDPRGCSIFWRSLGSSLMVNGTTTANENFWWRSCDSRWFDYSLTSSCRWRRGSFKCCWQYFRALFKKSRAWYSYCIFFAITIEVGRFFEPVFAWTPAGLKKLWNNCLNCFIPLSWF